MLYLVQRFETVKHIYRIEDEKVHVFSFSQRAGAWFLFQAKTQSESDWEGMSSKEIFAWIKSYKRGEELTGEDRDCMQLL